MVVGASSLQILLPTVLIESFRMRREYDCSVRGGGRLVVA